MTAVGEDRFDHIYYYEAYKQRLNDRRTLMKVFAAVSAALAVFVHPAWVIAVVLCLLFVWFGNSMYGGLHDYSHAAYPLACEFMKIVRDEGREKKTLPFACAPRMFHLALGEHLQSRETVRKLRGKAATDPADVTDAVAIVLNTTVRCVKCAATIDPAFMREWWLATADFKKFPRAAERLGPGDTCAACGAEDAIFESHLP